MTDIQCIVASWENTLPLLTNLPIPAPATRVRVHMPSHHSKNSYISFHKISVITDKMIVNERKQFRNEIIHNIGSFSKRVSVRNQQVGLIYNMLYKVMCIVPPPQRRVNREVAKRECLDHLLILLLGFHLPRSVILPSKLRVFMLLLMENISLLWNRPRSVFLVMASQLGGLRLSKKLKLENCSSPGPKSKSHPFFACIGTQSSTTSHDATLWRFKF